MPLLRNSAVELAELMTMHSYVQMRQQLSARRACAVRVSLSIGRQSFIARCFAGVGFCSKQKPHLRKAQLGIRARAMRVYPRALSATQTPSASAPVIGHIGSHRMDGRTKECRTKHKILPHPDSAAHHWLDGRVPIARMDQRIRIPSSLRHVACTCKPPFP